MMKIDEKRIVKIKGETYYLKENKKVSLGKICDHCALTEFCDELADNLNRIDYFACHDLVKDGKKWCLKHPRSYFIKLENENSI